MVIQKIRLSDFRNFKEELFEFSENTTVIIGPNASGKTNLLEGLYLLSTGKSFRARLEEEMINYSKDIARIKGRIKKDGETIDLAVVLTRGLVDIGASRSEKIVKKKLAVKGISKRLIDFAGNLKMTLFGPWDLGLVTESPSLRRRFLDSVLFQVDREYRRASLSYEKGLKQRNKLLLRIREEGTPRSQLLFWDKLLIKNGDYLSVKRGELIEFINENPSLNKEKFELEYDRSAISEARLEQYEEEEIAAATTLVGPHRDDFIFKLAGRNLARFGSRGEQRMAVLWLKLAELAFVKKITGERPTLLLDDILSELDHSHRKVVMKVSAKQQTIITTADLHFVEEFGGVDKIELKG